MMAGMEEIIGHEGNFYLMVILASLSFFFYRKHEKTWMTLYDFCFICVIFILVMPSPSTVFMFSYMNFCGLIFLTSYVPFSI
jgi:hypothetical protein